ncbi:serine hydrolase [Bifidobacterium sp. LC6]|uniref:Serine hydrolase n=1 Tax=Bifidobacterium colobi TaxID=2809026 RepID=A0ABS5UXT6_9BIFI|nr:serine hydrolase [Bifidobacterium colobi]
MAFCGQCGAKLLPGAAFCQECGAPVDSDSQPATPVSQPSAPVSQPAAPASQPQAVPSAQSPTPAPQPSTPAAQPSQPTQSLPPVQVPQQPQAPQSSEPQSAQMPSPVLPNPAADNLPPVPMPPIFDSAVPPVPSIPDATTTEAAPVDAKTKKRKKIIAAIIAAVVVVALVVAGVVYVKFRNNDAAEAPKATTAKTTKSKKTEKKFSFDSKTLDSIVDAAQPASVAAATTDGKAEYSSSKASQSGVATGLYLPVYLAVTNNGKTKNDQATDLLKNPSNDTANSLISQAGGLDAVNKWLKDNGYTHTELQRNYGDTAASQAGKENVTTAEDATNMLTVAERLGLSDLMNLDTQAEGITVPESMTVHGFYGKGIGGYYNYYFIIKDGDRTITLTVMTQQSKEAAAKLASDLLAEIHKQANPDNKGEGNKNSNNGDTAQNGNDGSNAVTPVQLTQSYTTQFDTVNMITVTKYSFQYPSDWTIGQPEITDQVEIVNLTNARGVTIQYYWGPIQGKFMKHETVTKVADAQFDAPCAQDCRNYQNPGPFMVAQIDGDEGSQLALVPDSYQGAHDFPAYTGYLFESYGYSSFATIDTKGGLTAQEKAEVIAILASLHSAQ